MAVLIVSSEADLHSRMVAWAIKEAGGDARILETSELISAQSFSFKHDSNFPMNAVRGYPFETANTIWVRRIFQPLSIPGVPVEERNYIRAESADFMRSIFNVLEDDKDIHWINKKSSLIRSEDKILQLKMAAEIGLLMPDTLVSKDAKEIRLFARSHEKVVIKAFNPHIWVSTNLGKHWMTYAKSVQSNDLISACDQSLEMAPCFYQKQIAKIFDVRVAVIGGKCFAAKILTDNKDIDFREYITKNGISYEKYTLPEHVEQNLHLLVNRLGLQFVSADFVVDEKGEIFFLELNPSGAFLFIEQNVGHPLVATMASELLKNEGININVDEIKGFKEYLDSIDYTNFRYLLNSIPDGIHLGSTLTVID